MRGSRAKNKDKNSEDLSHLLNFRYSAIGGDRGFSRPCYEMLREFNKEVFVRAQFRFKACFTGISDVDLKLRQALRDANKPIPWISIVQVSVDVNSSSGIPACPICLETPPLLPKMTRCGHIFCWPCILHYLSLGERNWRRCPLCFEAVYSKELKFVEFNVHNKLEVGDKVELKLVRRRRGSLEVKFQGENEMYESSFPLGLELISDVESILSKEHANIIEATDFISSIPGTYDSESLLPYIEMATSAFLEQSSHWNQRLQDASMLKKEFDSKSHSSNGDEFYYFYQVSDGRNIFLHSLNYRCLMKEFENTERLPCVISGNIIEQDTFQQDEHTQSKYRFLKHLPLTCDIQFCELDISNLLSDETKKAFSSDILARKKRREKNQRKQEIETQKLKASQSANLMESIQPDFNYFPEISYKSFQDDSYEELKQSIDFLPIPQKPNLSHWSGIAKHGFASNSGSWAPLVSSSEEQNLQQSKNTTSLVSGPTSFTSPPRASYSEISGRAASKNSNSNIPSKNLGKKNILFSNASTRRMR